jgi:hypothetical protein
MGGTDVPVTPFSDLRPRCNILFYQAESMAGGESDNTFSIKSCLCVTILLFCPLLGVGFPGFNRIKYKNSDKAR